MPNGNFTNPRYLSENEGLSYEELYDKYGYVPLADEYECESDYLSDLAAARRIEDPDYDESSSEYEDCDDDYLSENDESNYGGMNLWLWW
jgi:hypothetical protein